MKLAVATGLFGLFCCLSLHDDLVEARRLTVSEMPFPMVIVELLPLEDDQSSLSLRNRNPLNVKGSGWRGQIGNDEQGHARFESMEYGVRAAAMVLRSYVMKHGIDTVEGIINRFAEGNQKEYITYVSKRMGLAAAESFDVVRRMPELLRLMARFESGKSLPDRLFAPYDILEKI